MDFPWGRYGVQLFFLVSGFVILMTARRAKRSSDFAISRLSRLYPAYWIALTISIIVSIAFRVPHTDVGWTARIMNYTMVQRLLLFPNVDEVYWTLAIEMQFYILVMALLVILRCRVTTRRVLIAGALWLTLSLVLSVVLGGASRGVSPQNVVTPVKMLLNILVVEWGPLFVTGMLAHLARDDRRLRPAALGSGVVALAVTALLHGWQEPIPLVVVLAIFFVVVLRPSTPLLLLRPFQFYGRISYSLYIGHVVTGNALIHLLVTAVGRTVATVATFVAVTLFAMALHRVGEEWGSRRARTLLLRLRAMWDGARSTRSGSIRA